MWLIILRNVIAFYRTRVVLSVRLRSGRERTLYGRALHHISDSAALQDGNKAWCGNQQQQPQLDWTIGSGCRSGNRVCHLRSTARKPSLLHDVWADVYINTVYPLFDLALSAATWIKELSLLTYLLNCWSSLASSHYRRWKFHRLPVKGQ